MEFNKEVQEGIERARYFVVEGVEQILSGNTDEMHSVSASPGATALAALALLAVGRGFENAQQRGVQWLRQQQRGGWGKFPGDEQARQFSASILSLGQCVVPGLEGPTKDEIWLPKILEKRILAKLLIYGRSVIVAAQRAGRWLVQKQYLSGGWSAFDQLKIWAMGWAACVFGETTQKASDVPWLPRAVEWLKRGQNADGSYGSTPPFTHPDLDDTAVALIGLHQVLGEENQLGANLLKQLQNADGSWGTFPSFQGIPPHVSSEFPVYIPSVDVSIHVLEALWRRSRSQDESIWRGLTWVLVTPYP